MKRSHLIAILVAATFLCAIIIAVPVFLFLTWRGKTRELHETREFAREQMDLRVSVPTTTDAQSGFSPLIINVDVEGLIMVDGEAQTDAQILEKLRVISSFDKDQPIMIRSDKNARWESVAKVIAIIEDTGLWNISFATQNPAPE